MTIAAVGTAYPGPMRSACIDDVGHDVTHVEADPALARSARCVAAGTGRARALPVEALA